MFDPITGETPLGDLPTSDWATYVGMGKGGAGGSSQSQRFQAQLDFKQMFGRNPTESELAMVSPAYAGDKNNLNQSVGRAAVAQYFNTFANSPQNVAANQQKKYLADAPKFYDQINGMFKESLGRDATQAEKEHFGSVMAQGGTDTYTLQQFLTSLPEAVTKQDEAFRTNLSNTLQSQDARYFKEQIQPSMEARAVKQGRSLESSGVTNSLALAGQQQNTQREGFLTNLSAAQYAGSQGLAQDAYARAYGLSNGAYDTTSSRLDANSAALYGRQNSMNDYNIQKQAYDEYLQRYGRRNGAASGAMTGLASGAATGAAVGSVFPGIGTAIGAGVGAVVGGVGGYFAGR